MKKIKCLILILSVMSFTSVFAESGSVAAGDLTHRSRIEEAMKEIFSKFHHHHFHIFHKRNKFNGFL